MTKISVAQPGTAQPSAPSAGGRPGAAAPLTVASSVPEPAVNIQQLADKVYQLLLNDLSLQSRRASGQRK